MRNHTLTAVLRNLNRPSGDQGFLFELVAGSWATANQFAGKKIRFPTGPEYGRKLDLLVEPDLGLQMTTSFKQVFEKIGGKRGASADEARQRFKAAADQVKKDTGRRWKFVLPRSVVENAPSSYSEVLDEMTQLLVPFP